MAEDMGELIHEETPKPILKSERMYDVDFVLLATVFTMFAVFATLAITVVPDLIAEPTIPLILLQIVLIILTWSALVIGIRNMWQAGKRTKLVQLYERGLTNEAGEFIPMDTFKKVLFRFYVTGPCLVTFVTRQESSTPWVNLELSQKDLEEDRPIHIAKRLKDLGLEVEMKMPLWLRKSYSHVLGEEEKQLL